MRSKPFIETDRNDDERDQDFFVINQGRLDEEWLGQPKAFYRYALRLADAKADLERAKADRDVTAAEVDQEIRANPAAFGLGDKQTEAAIKNAGAVEVRIIKANKAIIKAKHEVDILQAAVDAMDHRKKALENLVHLFGMNYFAEPKAPKNAKERMQKVVRDGAFGSKKDKL